MKIKTRKSSKVSISTIIILILIATLSVVGYFITKNKNKPVEDTIIDNNNNNNNVQNEDDIILEDSDNVNIIKNSDKLKLYKFAKSIELENDTTSYTGYYKKLNNVSDENFLKTLTKIINDGAVLQKYAPAADLFKTSDTVVVDNQRYYYGMYDNKLYEFPWNGKIYNREHVWPNSRLGQVRVEMQERSIASDYHNLRFIEKNLNSRRNNYLFEEPKTSNRNADLVTDKSFFPGDKQKGDTVRILLYMAIKYPELKLTINPIGTSYKKSGMQMGDVTHFLKWHEEDKVDNFEINRNNEIFKRQKNRNPFIDNPQLFKKALKLKILSQFKVKSKKASIKKENKNYFIFYKKEENFVNNLF